MKNPANFAAALACAFALAACGGGGGGGGNAGASTSNGGTVNPPLGTLTLSAATLSFLGTGASASQNVTASEANYNGSFSATTSNCSGIAGIALQNGSVSTFVVTPVAAGSCGFTIMDTLGQSKSLGITVTTTSVGGS